MAKGKKTKKSEILRYMQMKKWKKQGMTPIDAFNLVGTMRFADIILNLKREGHIIETVIEQGKDRYGNTETYARYFLREVA